MTQLKPKVGGLAITEECIAVADEQLVDADHSGFGRDRIAHIFRLWHGGLKAVRLKKWFEPLEPPLQRPHHAVFVAGGQPRLPLIHPTRVSSCKHSFSSSLSAPDKPSMRPQRGAHASFFSRRFAAIAQPTLSSAISAIIPCEITQ